MLMILRWDENESQGFWLSSYGAKSSLELGSKCESGDSSPQPRACSVACGPSANHTGPSSTQAAAAFQVQASRASKRSWLCPWKCSRSFSSLLSSENCLFSNDNTVNAWVCGARQRKTRKVSWSRFLGWLQLHTYTFSHKQNGRQISTNWTEKDNLQGMLGSIRQEKREGFWFFCVSVEHSVKELLSLIAQNNQWILAV